MKERQNKSAIQIGGGRVDESTSKDKLDGNKNDGHRLNRQVDPQYARKNLAGWMCDLGNLNLTH